LTSRSGTKLKRIDVGRPPGRRLNGIAQYQIVSHGDEWDILHDGEVKHTP
jgi:hypothetical protein